MMTGDAITVGPDYTLILDPADPASRRTAQSTGLATLLLALNFATPLPPVATIFTPRATLPRVRRSAHAIVNRIGLSAVLGRPMKEVARGLVGLGEIDERLHGLLVALDVYQVTEGAHTLVSISIVRATRPADTGLGSTLGLWRLAREALIEHRVTCIEPVTIGDDAFFADYGRTAQIAWLIADRLVTVSVTCLEDAPACRLDGVRAIATYTADYLAVEESSSCLSTACPVGRRELDERSVGDFISSDLRTGLVSLWT